MAVEDELLETLWVQIQTAVQRGQKLLAIVRRLSGRGAQFDNADRVRTLLQGQGMRPQLEGQRDGQNHDPVQDERMRQAEPDPRDRTRLMEQAAQARLQIQELEESVNRLEQEVRQKAAELGEDVSQDLDQDGILDADQDINDRDRDRIPIQREHDLQTAEDNDLATDVNQDGQDDGVQARQQQQAERDRLDAQRKKDEAQAAEQGGDVGPAVATAGAVVAAEELDDQLDDRENQDLADQDARGLDVGEDGVLNSSVIGAENEPVSQQTGQGQDVQPGLDSEEPQGFEVRDGLIEPTGQDLSSDVAADSRSADSPQVSIGSIDADSTYAVGDNATVSRTYETGRQDSEVGQEGADVQPGPGSINGQTFAIGENATAASYDHSGNDGPAAQQDGSGQALPTAGDQREANQAAAENPQQARPADGPQVEDSAIADLRANAPARDGQSGRSQTPMSETDIESQQQKAGAGIAGAGTRIPPEMATAGAGGTGDGARSHQERQHAAPNQTGPSKQGGAGLSKGGSD